MTNSVTIGITAQLYFKDLIQKIDYDLDVELITYLRQILKKEVCSTFKKLHDLSSDRCKPGRFPSSKNFFTVRKDLRN